MEAVTTEIGSDVFKITVTIGAGEVSCFLLRSKVPAMVETNLGPAFPMVLDQVQRLVDPASIQYFCIPTFQLDECGALPQFLELAPDAVPVCSPPAASTYDLFCGRTAQVLGNGEVLDLGDRRLVGVQTPWAPNVDSMVFFDQDTGILISSDLFISPAYGQHVTSDDRTGEMVALYQRTGTFGSRFFLNHALSRIEALDVKVLAGMHGPSLTGDLTRYYRALRHGDVAELLDAPLYEHGLHTDRAI